jgi:hypothetical protein
VDGAFKLETIAGFWGGTFRLSCLGRGGKHESADDSHPTSA